MPTSAKLLFAAAMSAPGILKNFDAVLFDMDGVVCDNSRYHAAAWIEYAAKYFGLTVDLNDHRLHGGRNREVLSALLQRSVSESEVYHADQTKEKLYRKMARRNLKPLLGLNRYLTVLAENQIVVGLVTSAISENVAFLLNELGLNESFPIRVIGDDVIKGKPDPEPYLRAAELAQLDPARCLVHEDSIAGVISATSAGMKVVALSTSTQDSPLIQAGAIVCVKNFNHLLIHGSALDSKMFL